LSREQIIERERRWALPAALCAFGAVVATLVSTPVESGAIEGTGVAEQLRSINENGGALILSNVLRAIGLLLLIPPLLYLFEAARARSPRVRGLFVAFIFLGPILFAVQGIASGIATKDVASDYVARQGQLTVQPPSLNAFLSQVDKSPDSFEKVTFYPDANALDAERSNGDVFTLEYPPGREQAIENAVDNAGIDNDEVTDGRPGDLAARNLLDDSSAHKSIAVFVFPAVLALIVGVFYPSMSAMRVGLLTRFFGTLGMAIAVSVLFIGLLGLMLWTLALGLLILGRWPGGRPPAWEAGEAVPWPPPGGPPAEEAGTATAIEGEGAEVASPTGEGPQRRKRKQRR
jgi:hypothetical protein